MEMNDFDVILGQEFLKGKKAIVVSFYDEDVANTNMMENKLEIDQVEPGSCSLSTRMYEVTHKEEPHDDEVSIDTCVSFGHLLDGLYAGKGKASVLMQGRILPWMSMMRSYMEKQGFFIVAGLVGVVCDLMVEGTKALDKGGT